ncbi:MAG: DUF4349 domain-containing protein [candidate division Zixibacteria bacterium]
MLNRLTMLTVILLLVGCAGSMQSAIRTNPESPTRQKSDLSNLDDRLIISSADLEIKTEQSDSLHNKIMDIAANYDGYVLSSGNDISTIRLPAISFKRALDDIEKLGEVIEKKVAGNDVTEQYRDFEIRLENAIKTRGRYLALLEKADDINEILRLEKELERFNGKIESLKGSLERLSHLVYYSTITVKTYEKIKPGPISYAVHRLYSGVKWLFVRN